MQICTAGLPGWYTTIVTKKQYCILTETAA